MGFLGGGSGFWVFFGLGFGFGLGRLCTACTTWPSAAARRPRHCPRRCPRSRPRQAPRRKRAAARRPQGRRQVVAAAARARRCRRPPRCREEGSTACDAEGCSPGCMGLQPGVRRVAAGGAQGCTAALGSSGVSVYVSASRLLLRTASSHSAAVAVGAPPTACTVSPPLMRKWDRPPAPGMQA